MRLGISRELVIVRAVKLVLAVAVLAPAVASAEPLSPEADLSLRSQIGFGQSLAPNLVSITTEAGYVGAAQTSINQNSATADFAVEGRVYKGLSIRATTELGGLDTRTRPAIGAAYQILDPRTDVIGLRFSSTYKPEGFNEPEGELEHVAVVSKLVGADSVRGFAAFGSDIDFNEADGELGGAYLHTFDPRVVAGASMRYRYGFKTKETGEPNWDVTAGAIAAVMVNRVRLEGFAGNETINLLGATHSGLVALFGLGLDL
jgi:hypothetical protein